MVLNHSTALLPPLPLITLDLLPLQLLKLLDILPKVLLLRLSVLLDLVEVPISAQYLLQKIRVRKYGLVVSEQVPDVLQVLPVSILLVLSQIEENKGLGSREASG